MKKIKIFIVINLLLLSKTFACSCEYQGSFLKVSTETSFIALIKVSRYLTFKDIYGEKTPMSMEVELIETYKGKEERKTFKVWGDPGNLCRPYLNKFKEGQYYVIAFSSAREDKNDYSISICGTYWLNVNFENLTANGDVQGNKEVVSTISLSQLKGEIKKTNN